MSAPTTDLRYPIGPFEWSSPGDSASRAALIADIRELPRQLRAAVAGLSEPQLETPYRPEGWTVRQLVHHVADSHMNSFVRFKLGLTEDVPTIKPYDEARWARTADSAVPIELSLALLDSLHARWTALLESFSEADFARRLRHPQSGEMSLDKMLALYSWHGRHHVRHVTALRERMGW